MKKVFNSLILIFLLPIKIIKKTFRDNFLSGLILGALFSLLVNIVSMHIQGKIEKQRVLEGIEHEIMTNILQANQNIITANDQKNKDANPFIVIRKFSRDFWEQTGEPWKYLGQLNSTIQSEISTYYTVVIPEANATIEISNNLYFEQMKDCFNFEKLKSDIEKYLCNLKFNSYLTNNALYISDYVFKTSRKILEIFHPTQDRLNDPMLRLLMGKDAVKILMKK